MHVELRGELVIVHDREPGQHATLFGPAGKPLAFDGTNSRFDDRRRAYEWAFSGGAATGQRVVFATADREVEAVIGGEATVATLGSLVVRDPSGKPLRLVGASLPAPAPPSPQVDAAWPPCVLARDL